MPKNNQNLEILEPDNGADKGPLHPKDVLVREDEQSIPDRIDLKGKLSNVPAHNHDGNDLERTKLQDIGGLIETIPAVPTHIPKNIFDQVKIYINAGTPELYIYDYVNTTWRKFT